MFLHYALSAEDYVNQLLFFQSVNKQAIKRRRYNWMISIVLSLVPPFLAVSRHRWGIAVVFFIIAVILMATYPSRTKATTRRRFLKYVEENYHNRLGKEAGLEITSNEIRMTEDGADARISFSQVETVYEVPQHFFIEFLSSSILIIPKAQVDAPAVQAHLQSIAAQQGKEYVDMREWKW